MAGKADVSVPVIHQPKRSEITLETAGKATWTRTINCMQALDKESAIFITQRMAEDLKGGCGGANSYELKNVAGEQVMHAEEEASCVCRWCCGPQRSLFLSLHGRDSNMALLFDRKACKCDSFLCCTPCLHKLLVVDSNETLLGTIQQRWSCCGVKVDVRHGDDSLAFRIRGPSCPCRCCTQMQLDIMSPSEEKEVGYIIKRWQHEDTDVNMDHEHFEVQFPANCSMNEKALLLGATFLVNYMFFEMS